MKKIYGNFVGERAALGLLIIRLVFGLGIMMHGSPEKSPHIWKDKLKEKR